MDAKFKLEQRLTGVMNKAKSYLSGWRKNQIEKFKSDLKFSMDKFKRSHDKNDQLTDTEILDMDLLCHYEPSKTTMAPWVKKIEKLSYRKNKPIYLSNIALSVFILDKIYCGKHTEAQRAFQLLTTKETAQENDCELKKYYQSPSEYAKKRITSEHYKSIAQKSTPSPLNDILKEIATKNPSYSYKEIASALSKYIGKGIIMAITDDNVSWLNINNEIEETKFSALRGRIDRVRNTKIHASS